MQRLGEKLEAENTALRKENAELRLENTRLKVENQLLRDEIARLKNLPPRPPFKPSGMDKATDAKAQDKQAGKKKPRGPKLDVERVDRDVVLHARVPDGSRFKGYKSYYVRDIVLRAEVIHYRRECWVAPNGKTILAPLPAGIVGGYGPNLRRLCLMLHAQGQVTAQRLSTLLNDIGMDISKRQVVRLLTKGLDGFVAEDAAVLHAGLVSEAYVTVDDTGARHARDNFYTTHIGGEHFTVFRTTKTKSRLNFLSLLRGNYQDYVLNDATSDYLKTRHGVDPTVIARLQTRTPQRFSNQVPFLEHLAQKVSTSSIRTWFGSSRKRASGVLFATTACWAMPSLSPTMPASSGLAIMRCAGCMRAAAAKLMPATPQHVRWVENIRDLIWSFYKALKAFRQKSPSPGSISAFRQRFDRIFSIRTGCMELDKLLARLLRRKEELLKVLERPEIPLHTNASENDLRSCVTKRKISGGTMSNDGRIARDTMLGLMKTCKSFGFPSGIISATGGISSQQTAIPELAGLIIAKA